MGLDVGVVTIEYMDSTGQPVEEFLSDLLLSPYTGVDGDYDDEENWGGSWADNGLYEFGRAGLISRASNWADDHEISPQERTALLSWVKALPWRDDMVILHLGI